MNIAPIYKSRYAHIEKTLHIGVEIQYEEDDAEELMHILRFFEAHEKERRRKFTLMPTITHNGKKTTCASLLEQFAKLPEGRSVIVGIIAVHFLDEMRPVFDAYIASLRQMKDDAKKEHGWDEAHPLFIITNYFEIIATGFFPDKTTMH